MFLLFVPENDFSCLRDILRKTSMTRRAMRNPLSYKLLRKERLLLRKEMLCALYNTPGKNSLLIKILVFFSFSKFFKFFYLKSYANNKNVISIYLNCNAIIVQISHTRYWNHRMRNHETRTRAYCIFYILLTFTPDTVRSLVLSECLQKVW